MTPDKIVSFLLNFNHISSLVNHLHIDIRVALVILYSVIL